MMKWGEMQVKVQSWVTIYIQPDPMGSSGINGTSELVLPQYWVFPYWSTIDSGS